MPCKLERFEINHPWSDIPHDPPNRFPLFGRIAMGRAFPADGFVFAVSTGIQPPVGIDDQIRAVPAER